MTKINKINRPRIADYTLTNIILSAILAAVFTMYEIPCVRQGVELIFFDFLMFIHHFGKLFIWLAPFFVTNATILVVLVIIWGYVCVQNVVRTGTTQPCILSNYINKQCGVNENEPLRDIFYHLGLKDDIRSFNKMFNVLSWILLAVLILKTIYVLRWNKR